MKRKILLAAVAVICLSLLGVGTLAYFTSDGTAHNVITTGGVDIELIETTDDGKPFPSEGVTGVMPGESVTKRVTVKNTGLSEAWVRVRADMEVKDSNGEVMTGEHPIELTGKDSKWVAKDGYYYYTEPVAPGAETKALLEEVTFLPQMGNPYQGSTLNIDIFAQATQVANNGETVWEAQGWPESNS